MSVESAFTTPPTMVEVDGVSTPASFAPLAEEIRALRISTGLSWRPDVARMVVSGPGAWDVVDRVCSTDLYLRDCQLRHTLMLDDDGRAIADVYVGNDDDKFLLMAEGLSADALRSHVAAHAPEGASYELVDLARTHELLAIDGPFAWEVLATLEGPEVVGFPFLSLYHPREGSTYVRAGKTGEYGYSLLVPRQEAPELWRAILAAGAPLNLREVGVHSLWHTEFENRFFNIHREGRAPRCSPIELQLQWRLAREDKQYVGRDALRARRVTHRATALVASAALKPGDPVTYQDRAIGSVIEAQLSETIGLPIGLALIENELAHSGIDRFAAGGVPVRTVSPPFVNNLSLYVNLQRDAWATRGEIAYRGPLPIGIAPP